MLRRTRVRFGAVGLAALSLGALFAPPASSAVVGAITFQGEATLSTGFGYPVLTHNSASFTFHSTTCVDGSLGKKINGGTECHISASGTVSGACGLATASGSGVYTASDGHTYDFTFGLNHEATTFTLTGNIRKRGTNQFGPLLAEGSITPKSDASGGTCANKTQKNFIIAAEALIVLT